MAFMQAGGGKEQCNISTYMVFQWGSCNLIFSRGTTGGALIELPNI